MPDLYLFLEKLYPQLLRNWLFSSTNDHVTIALECCCYSFSCSAGVSAQGLARVTHAPSHGAATPALVLEYYSSAPESHWPGAGHGGQSA